MNSTSPEFYIPSTALWVPFAISALLAYPILLMLIRLKSRQTVSQFAPEGHQKKHGLPAPFHVA